MSDAMKNQVGDWYPLLESLFKSDKFKAIRTGIVSAKAKGAIVYPETKKTFRAFKLCKLENLKVVILAEGPYHDGSATGLAFASENYQTSPSLKAINLALEKDYNTLNVDMDTSLISWARQGVLLLNTALSVEKGVPGSHRELWEPFIQELLELLTNHKEQIVFMLWGNRAQEFIPYIKGNQIILEAAHPEAEVNSGGKTGFYSCYHFSKANSYLKRRIRWCDSCIVPF